MQPICNHWHLPWHSVPSANTMQSVIAAVINWNNKLFLLLRFPVLL